ncbi:hypothetical protein BC833DRAFT_210908 [Globomyces pollinis-pini]|nr:hypothetical protein BC833DRAFT_210908 [Globomyces pollinis-pini]
MSFITECLKSCLCCFQSNRQLPIYDYDEIDDLEFENLLARPGTSPFSQQQPRNSIWNDLAALFRFKSKNSKNSYQSVPTYDQQDLLFDQDQQTDAELLTPEQISMMTSANMPPQEVIIY